MIVYLVASTPDSGIAEARGRGWQQIAYTRFATPEKHDVRVACRASDIAPMRGITALLKGADYDSGPVEGEGELSARIEGLRSEYDAAAELAEADKSMALMANRLSYQAGLLEKWARERKSIEEFVASGAAEWVEI